MRGGVGAAAVTEGRAAAGGLVGCVQRVAHAHAEILVAVGSLLPIKVARAQVNGWLQGQQRLHHLGSMGSGVIGAGGAIKDREGGYSALGKGHLWCG